VTATAKQHAGRVAVALMLMVSGLLLRAEPEQLVGTWTSKASINDARSGAAAVPLADGRTLIAGGIGSNGLPTSSVVIYDPTANSFSAAGDMIAVRTGHSATLLKDGRVVIAGGTANGVISSDIEIFDPSTGTSSLASVLPQPRTGHAAARLGDGSVLIVGGSTIDGVVLQSAAIFEPATGTITATAGLQQARVGASATTLIDGRVLVAGGNNGSGDLGTAEIFDPFFQTFTIVGTQLSVPRSGHTAVLLLHNNSVLIAGGTAAGVAVTATDLFLPAQFPDPYSYGTGQFAATGSLGTARSGAVGGPSGDNGYAYVAGGGSADAEAYRFATIKTDKDDYAPGQQAIITGSGWQANEEVTLLFQEDPAVHADYLLHVTADGAGNISWDKWSPEQHDLGVTFYLLALGSQSRAQTRFTDAELETAELTGTENDVTVTQGSSANFTITLFATGKISAAITSTSPSKAEVKTVYALNSGVLTSTVFSADFNFFSSGMNCTGGPNPNCDVTWTGAPTRYTVPASISADALTAVGTYTITLSESLGTTLTINAGGPGGKLDDTTPTAITVHVVAPANTAPTATVNLTPDPAYTNDTLTATATKADADGDPVTLTYVWKVNGTTVKTTSGTSNLTDTLNMTLAGNGNKGDTVSVEVTPNDGKVNGTTSSDSLIVSNSLPTATVNLTPDPAHTDDTLTATATKADADGDPVTLTYVWKVNGTTVKTTSGTSNLTDTLNMTLAGNGNKGDTVSVEVTPNDGTANGSTASDSLIVSNSLPTATVNLTPDPAFTNDTLTATATKADVDGEPVTLTYVWKVNGTTVKTTSDTSSLTDTLDMTVAGNGNKGDTVSVEVTPNDGTANGSAASDSLIVSNSLPTATVNLTPDPAFTNDTLTATVTKADVDGDPVTLTYVWKVNGTTVKTTSGSSSLTDTLNMGLAGNGNKGDTVSVEVTPNDGTANGSVASDLLVVSNSLPNATVNLTPDPAFTNDTLTATATKADADGDPVTLTYVWKVNGTTVKTTSGSSSLTDTLNMGLAGNGNKGDTVSVEVTPNDGTANGTMVSDSVVVSNTPPVLSAITTPMSTPWGATLGFTATATDADNDSLTFSLIGAPVGASIGGTSGLLSWTPTNAQIGSHSFTVKVSDTDLAYDDQGVTVNVTVRGTTLTYSGDSTAEYSDVASVKATLLDTLTSSPIAGATITFTIGSQSTIATTNGSGLATGGITLSQPSSSPGVISLFAGNSLYGPAGDSDPFTIDEEDVILDYIGDSIKGIPPPGGLVTLKMNAAVNEAADGSLGSKLYPETKVHFELYGDGGPSVGSCDAPVSNVGPGVGTTAPTGCTIDVTVTLPTTYEVRMTLVDDTPGVYYELPTGVSYFTGGATVDIAVAGTSTGGVWFYEPTVPADLADAQKRKVNIGFTASYVDLKKKTGARGNMVAVWRTNSDLSTISPQFPSGIADYNIIVKSTSTTAAGSSMYLQECVPTTQCYVSFAGKATVKAVNRSTGATYNLGDLLGGGAQFQVDGLDAGEPGSTGPGPDTFAIRVWAAGGNIIVFDGLMGSPSYDGDKDNNGSSSRKQILINGGNVQVHK